MGDNFCPWAIGVLGGLGVAWVIIHAFGGSFFRNQGPREGRFAKGAKHDMTALQGWIVIGLLVLIMLGIVGLGAEIQALPYLWRTSASEIK
jgi:hypothetical protein